MLNLKTGVERVPKIGPKYKKLLEKLEIKTVEDLLYHFPYRYDDYSQNKNVTDLLEGEISTLEGTIKKVDNIYTKFGKKITKAVFEDVTGKVGLVWFNQPYLKNSLKIGESYLVSGKAVKFKNKFSVVAPEIDLLSKGSHLNTGRLIPVYPETLGVNSRWLRHRINDVLNVADDFDEFLPESIINTEKIPNFKDALNNIHFPDDILQAEKAKKRFAYEELFMEMIKVEIRKNEWEIKLNAPILKPYKTRVDKYIENLPFILTQSQKRTISEIAVDLNKPHPMNRLLEGDVGSGKTIVAVISSYIALLNGTKVLYMAPTEILANQHYKTFQNYFKNYKIQLLTSATSKNFEKDFDIIIGTHALIHKGGFNDIGLVIVDEQHRFGVEQRSKLIELSKQRANTPHLLTMTATPIPRTLALTLYGDLELSKLTENPNANKKITTKIIPEKLREQAYVAIKNKNEPTFIVCPLINESDAENMENIKAAEAEFEKLKKGVFKKTNVGLLHGRMTSKEKLSVIEKFKNGEIKVLVSTPVIEVGVDIPEASIIVVESAERYGLASLHQLRGRVGRGGKEGFCYVFMSNNSRNAYIRLKYLENITSGMELAEIDMKLRGEGDIFSTIQHGFKKFKLADLNNVTLLEKVKIDVRNTFLELEKYPLLEKKVLDKSGKLVANN